MGYIKVRDFAKETGCTAQNIYKHLRRYTKELEGHVITGPGKQGQLLDDQAQEFLRSVMYPKSITVDSDTMAAELAEMRAAMMKLGQENLRLAAELATTQGERDRALLDVSHHQKLLKAAGEAEEAQKAEKEQIAQEAAAAAQKAQEELKTARERERLLMSYAAAMEAWNALGWWKRRKADKPTMPVLPGEE